MKVELAVVHKVHLIKIRIVVEPSPPIQCTYQRSHGSHCSSAVESQTYQRRGKDVAYQECSIDSFKYGYDYSVQI